MKRPLYCCDASRETYENYYRVQAGRGIGIYSGARGQLGHGLGSILSGIARSAVPLLTKIGKSLAPKAIDSGLKIASDMLEGQSFGDSAKRRVSEAIKGYTQPNNQPVKAKKRKHKRRKRDIFD